jgi:hypothetical protein
MIDEQAVRTRYEALLGCLDERGRLSILKIRNAEKA